MLRKGSDELVALAKASFQPRNACRFTRDLAQQPDQLEFVLGKLRAALDSARIRRFVKQWEKLG